jgi:hypothetical protein
MAHHDTNTKKEARRHAFPLIVLAVILVVVMVGFLWWISKAAGVPGEADPVPGGGIEGENTEIMGREPIER